MQNVILITTWIDAELYSRCVSKNPFVLDNPAIELAGFDNSQKNLPIPVRYNQFLDTYDYSKPAWFVFCHSDWELLEDPVPLLEQLDQHCLYGPIGAFLVQNCDGSLLRTSGGIILEKRRDGSDARIQGTLRSFTGQMVDTFDCQCMIVHSSLVQKYHLRFDENLHFDLYIEDFCIMAKSRYSIASKILRIECCHWSQVDSIKERPQYTAALKYLSQKYPDALYAGTVSLIAGNSAKIRARMPFVKIWEVLLLCIEGVLILPATAVSCSSLAEYLQNLRRGRRFFGDIFRNAGEIFAKLETKKALVRILVKYPLKLALKLRETGSIVVTMHRLLLFFRKKYFMLRYGSCELLLYRDHIQRTEPKSADLAAMRAEKWSHKLLFSLVLCLNNSAASAHDTLQSVQKQIYNQWELLIIADKKAAEYAKRDARIHVLDTERNILPEQQALHAASGDYILFLDAGDQIAPFALYRLAKEILAYPDAKLIYSDADVCKKGKRQNPFFKPDWNEDLQLAEDYIGRLAAYRITDLKKVGGFRNDFVPCHMYDATLRIAKICADGQIRHIPEVLYHYASNAFCLFAKKQQSAAKKAAAAYLESQGMHAVITSVNLGVNKIEYTLPEPLPSVSCIVAMKDHADLTEKCLDGLLHGTDYPNLEILLVDNGSTESASLDLFRHMEKENRVKIIHWEKPFNYSEIQNMGAREAQGKFLALINNDIDIHDSSWLRKMLGYAQRDKTGAVGTKLLWHENRLQHAGIITGMFFLAGHAFLDQPEQTHAQKCLVQIAHQVSAVTAAVMVIEKEKYFAVGGMNEKDVPISFSDVDFCLRLLQAGYQNCYMPYTRIFHLESASRGIMPQTELYKSVCYFVRHYSAFLENDPQYNVNLSLMNAHYEVLAADEPCRRADCQDHT